ncbi:Exostosin family [Seminavis robusta]|uniref:Exostosin family n=1 Tax=Seminavis robusta TaxID=568900 RepID=A0A9N8HTT0_9STRA|nr:Exostosin family [Seminavis robusta]|eukprot:Sro1310_g261650.1 Exostosin family (494) ;mRNA; f:16527-18008
MRCCGCKVHKPACLLVLGLVIGVQIFLFQSDDAVNVFVLSEPKLMDNLPYGEHDDFREGRSCFYHSPHKFPWMPLWEKSPWTCQECNNGKCKPLVPHGRCPPFRRRETDQVPRVMSQASPLTNQKSHTLVYHHDSHTSYAQVETPACSGTLAMPCFDLNRCSRFGPVKVFGYGKTVEAWVDYAVTQTKGVDVIQKTNNPQDACLLVVGRDSFAAPEELLQSKHWKGGRNHYIFNSIELFGTHGDRPFNTKCHFGMAATSQVSADDAFSREGFDTPMGLYPKWKRPEQYRELDINRKRRLILSFRGAVYSWEQRYWQHRWIASEYWEKASDISVDTKCGIKRIKPEMDEEKRLNPGKIDYEVKDGKAHEEMLLNSTFVFCPGGGGANSFRFPEALSADAIPVVTSDFLPPFSPEVDWSNCLVRVSEARVVDIPNIVRTIPEEEIRKRRKECKLLYDKVYGNEISQHFTVAMQVWAIRIKSALRRKFEMLDIVLA